MIHTLSIDIRIYDTKPYSKLWYTCSPINNCMLYFLKSSFYKKHDDSLLGYFGEISLVAHNGYLRHLYLLCLAGDGFHISFQLFKLRLHRFHTKKQRKEVWKDIINICFDVKWPWRWCTMKDRRSVIMLSSRRQLTPSYSETLKILTKKRGYAELAAVASWWRLVPAASAAWAAEERCYA